MAGEGWTKWALGSLRKAGSYWHGTLVPLQGTPSMRVQKIMSRKIDPKSLQFKKINSRRELCETLFHLCEADCGRALLFCIRRLLQAHKILH